MSVLLVTYDLNKPGQDYTDFLKVVRDYPYARLSESSYAIATNENTKQVFDKLNPYTDANDSLSVIKFSPAWWSKTPKAVLDWLQAYLK